MDEILGNFLAIAAGGKLEETLRAKRLERLDAYYRGRQYQGRKLDAEGYRKTARGVYGYAQRTPPWDERDPGCVWNLREEVVQELTDWTLGGDAWCALRIPDDGEAEEYLGALAGAVGVSAKMAEARDLAGGLGTGILAVDFRDGAFHLEALSALQTWALAWRDEARHVPSLVAQVYFADDALAREPDDYPMICRVWDERAIATYKRVKKTGPDGQSVWTWEVLAAPRAHGIPRCPVFWLPSRVEDGRHDGLADGEGSESEIDEANYLLAAAGCTTKRNADDTTVITPMAGQSVGARVRKGGYNVIVAADAKYLTQEGESARVCVELAEVYAHRVYGRAGLNRVNEQELAKEASGEAKRYRFFRTLKTAQRERERWAEGMIVPLCHALLDVVRRLAPAAASAMVPPRIEEATSGDEVTKRLVARSPGRSGFVTCEWPNPFPPSSADKAATITAAVAGTGGKQVMSVATAIGTLAAVGVPVQSVEQEMQRIEEDGERAAEQGAAALGLAADAKGAAGAIDDEPADDEGKGAAA